MKDRQKHFEKLLDTYTFVVYVSQTHILLMHCPIIFKYQIRYLCCQNRCGIKIEES